MLLLILMSIIFIILLITLAYTIFYKCITQPTNNNPKINNNFILEKLKLRVWELEARINGLHNRPECYLTTIKPEWLPIFMQISDISGSEIAFGNRGRTNTGEIIAGQMSVYVRPSHKTKFLKTFRGLVRWKKGPTPYIPIQSI